MGHWAPALAARILELETRPTLAERQGLSAAGAAEEAPAATQTVMVETVAQHCMAAAEVAARRAAVAHRDRGEPVSLAGTVGLTASQALPQEVAEAETLRVRAVRCGYGSDLTP